MSRRTIALIGAGMLAFGSGSGAAAAQDQSAQEINPPEADIFKEVSDAYDREEAAGNFIEDSPEEPEHFEPQEPDPVVIDEPMTPEEIQQVYDEQGDPDRPFGDPEQYHDDSSGEPLPEKAPPSEPDPEL